MHKEPRVKEKYGMKCTFFSLILLTHKGSHPGRSTRNSNPVMTSSAGSVPRPVLLFSCASPNMSYLSTASKQASGKALSEECCINAISI